MTETNDWQLSCECGFRVESTDLDDLVERAKRHARGVHGMELSAEQLATLARRAAAAERG
jgi:predicted small metal-binding protein